VIQYETGGIVVSFFFDPIGVGVILDRNYGAVCSYGLMCSPAKPE
jgi:hypothetical protein